MYCKLHLRIDVWVYQLSHEFSVNKIVRFVDSLLSSVTTKQNRFEENFARHELITELRSAQAPRSEQLL